MKNFKVSKMFERPLSVIVEPDICHTIEEAKLEAVFRLSCGKVE